MAVLSKRSVRNGPSSGHDFDRINEKLFGSARSKMNKRKDLFGSDYIFVYKESLDDDDLDNDGEIGINKNYHRIHDTDWCNGEKNEEHHINRFLDQVKDRFEDIREMLSITEFFSEIEDLLLEDEGNSNE